MLEEPDLVKDVDLLPWFVVVEMLGEVVGRDKDTPRASLRFHALSSRTAWIYPGLW